MIGPSSLRRTLFFARLRDRAFLWLGRMFLAVAVGVLVALVLDLGRVGGERFTWDFLSQYPSRFAGKSGVLSAWVGTLVVMLVTAVTAIPLGVLSAVYLEEYAPRNRVTDFIEVNISNLAGVPSIIYGLMALGLFVYRMDLGQSIVTAGLTLGLLVLPIIIVTTREAIRTVPQHIREASYALGATRWQTLQHHILPYSTGGITTGVIIALSRAIGETAPVITIGAVTYIAFLPSPPVMLEPPFVSWAWLSDAFTVLPLQMFNWVSRPQREFHMNAAAAGLLLLCLTLGLNAGAILIRNRYRRRIKW